MSLPEDDPERPSLGWCGYRCRSCMSVILVGVVPVGWGSIAIPTCPATNRDHYACEGKLDEMDGDTLHQVLSALNPQVTP